MVGVGTDLDLEAVLVPVLVPVLVALGLGLGLAATAAGPVRCRGDDEPTSHALTNRPCRSIETPNVIRLRPSGNPNQPQLQLFFE
jgi:hypothetical protein